MVKEIEWPDLKTYERKPLFWTDGAATGVVFQAPVNGKTTPNSENPRSELRQMYNNGDPAAWSNKTATWSMEALMAFNVAPNSSDDTRGVVGMQVHDGNDDVTVLRYERSGELWVTSGDDTHPSGGLINPSYVLGTFMLVKIEARKGGGFRWFVNGTLEATPVSGTRSGCYFKAGCYTQGNESNSSGFGRTTFKSLKVWRS